MANRVLPLRDLTAPLEQAPVTLKTGDVFIVETGAKGTWTVHENLRKYYVFALGH
jgi:uncharacterized cupin superfamily protein